MVQFDVKRISKGAESFMVSFDLARTPITQVADYIIIAASKNNSSDIHFDPREEGMMVRFRIDGDLQDYTFIPKAYERNLTTRLKLLANMNITESRLPQDGAIKGTFGDTYLDMRVSCLPVNEGEKVVIRILDYTRSLQGIDTLGFNPKNLEKLKRMMNTPNGIILVTGATGSGKSTTTYSILQGLNKPETNIITVEDPIEMNIEGINQVQVNSEIGMTFAAALRSILRQDPNVILIGEIRDSETAQIAVRASITGHLVLSTIHTNNSLSTIERLLDMEVERYLLSTALTGIISQRLAKQLCKHCRYQRETTKYEKKIFKRFMHKDVATLWDANSKGCENCRKGYRGRIAIQEVLELDDDIRAALNNEKLEKEDLIKMVYTGKTITMLQDALGKALEGLTSFDEVYRVIEIENEDDDNYSENMTQAADDYTDLPQVNENAQQQVSQSPVPIKNEILQLPTISINTTQPVQETPKNNPPIESPKSTEIIELPFIKPVEENKTKQKQEQTIQDEPIIPTPNEIDVTSIITNDQVPIEQLATDSEEVKKTKQEQTLEEQIIDEIDYSKISDDSIQEIEENTPVFAKLDETPEPNNIVNSLEDVEVKPDISKEIVENNKEETNIEEIPTDIPEDIPQIQATSIISKEENEQELTETASEILLEPGIKIVPPKEENFTSLDFSLRDFEEQEQQKEEEEKKKKAEAKKKMNEPLKETDFIPPTKLNEEPILPNI